MLADIFFHSEAKKSKNNTIPLYLIESLGNALKVLILFVHAWSGCFVLPGVLSQGAKVAHPVNGNRGVQEDILSSVRSGSWLELREGTWKAADFAEIHLKKTLEFNYFVDQSDLRTQL